MNTPEVVKAELAKGLETILRDDPGIKTFGLSLRREARLVKQTAKLMAAYPHLIKITTC